MNWINMYQDINQVEEMNNIVLNQIINNMGIFNNNIMNNIIINFLGNEQ